MNSLKSMGVINITPDSFSDGSEIQTSSDLSRKISSFINADILDFGAESSAPMNSAITWEQELARFLPYVELITTSNKTISIDTYHPETMSFFSDLWIKKGLKNPLIWNDVSGKWDDSVEKFLSTSTNFYYVYSHNLAPSRQETLKHMDYKSECLGEDFLRELANYFAIGFRENVIIDPCLGFSKSFDQNWCILEHFSTLQKMTYWDKWLLGLSRKSFLRQKYDLSKDLKDREQLDLMHAHEIDRLCKDWLGTVWVRTHRPELINP